MTEPTPSSEDASVAAILMQRSRADQSELLADLVALLSETVPDVHVERSLLRRHVTAIRLPLGSYIYTLKKGSGDSFDALRQHVVGGVAIRTTPLDIDVFLTELGLALDIELRRTERGRAALQAWLSPPNS